MNWVRRRITVRRAFTLVELMVVITISSIVLGTLTGVLHIVYQANHRVDDGLNHASSLSRLAFQFRTDVHAARSASIETRDAKEILRLKYANNRIVDYFAADGLARRFQWQGNKLEHQESFRVHEDAAMKLGIVDEQPKVASIEIEATRHLRIEAVVGRDRRFAAGDE